MKKIIAFSIIMLAFSAGIYAQQATANAVIVTPLSMTHVADLYFGNIIADVDGGTVVVDADGTGTRTLNGLTSPSIPGTINAAEFTIAGLADASYSISLPASNTISNGTVNMTVDTFTSTPNASGTLDNTGAGTLYVGATLNVGATQAPGTYTSTAPFTVTVNYN
jgi:hypothetical protein